MFPTEMTSARLHLREFDERDLGTVMAIEQQQGEVFAYRDSASTEEGVSRWWRWIFDGQRADPRTDYRFAAELDNQLIGIARVCIDWAPTRKGSIGYAFAKAHWGKGIGTEAARLVTDFGFKQLNLHRIEATIEPDNLRSQRVSEKLGMTYEGRMRDNFLVGEEWRDALLYAVLEDEWPTSNSV